jgi:hypothetical protein
MARNHLMLDMLMIIEFRKLNKELEKVIWNEFILLYYYILILEINYLNNCIN